MKCGQKIKIKDGSILAVGYSCLFQKVGEVSGESRYPDEKVQVYFEHYGQTVLVSKAALEILN